jgi:hypothetical protein
MMYKKHSAFITPPINCTIWRYMSFLKFVWLVAKESLFFSRLDQHNDSWEGLLPLPLNCDIEQKKYARFNKYINCWHMNENESDAMWKLYGNPVGETVAIKTTVGGLIKSLEKTNFTVYLGKINYEEQDRHVSNLYLPVTQKRKPFQHEKELRLCVSSAYNSNPPDLTNLRQALSTIGNGKWSDLEILKEIGDKSIEVPVNIKQLIHEVVLCPNSKLSLSDSVQYIIADKLPRVKIRESKI